MLSFAAITPHPPLAIPNIGEDNIEKISKTTSSLKKLAALILEKKLDSLIVISPHGNNERDFFVFNMNAIFEADFKTFGDFTSKSSYFCDTVLTQQLKEVDNDLSIYSSNQEVDHGVAVPLFYLLGNSKELPVVLINSSLSSCDDNFSFGKNLQKIIHSSNKRIGVIASGDLSHRLTKTAPGGFSPEGQLFDEKLLGFIKNDNTEAITQIDQKLADQAGECGLRPISMIYGILDKLNYQTEILSYESPFGVGYLTVNFNID